MLNCKNMKYAPLVCPKLNKFPDKLIYEQRSSVVGLRKYVIFSTKSGENALGKMICYPSTVERAGQGKQNSLYVWSLFSPTSGKGVGTAMLDFAKVLSYQLGCGGRFHLSADSGWFPNRVPHIFYRKYGMTTDSQYFDRRLDKFVKKGKNATHLDFPTMDMFYPPLVRSEKDGLLTKILRFLHFDVK